MRLRIDPEGNILALYQENLVLGELGPAEVQRASHVEPEGDLWFVDLGPAGGPKVGGFEKRSTAIQIEVEWIEANVL